MCFLGDGKRNPKYNFCRKETKINFKENNLRSIESEGPEFFNRLIYNIYCENLAGVTRKKTLMTLYG
jgi:hypothetical protein